MGERFYLAQQEYRPKRKLKKEYIEYINSFFEEEVTGLDKLTIKTLEVLGDNLLKLKGNN